MLRLVVCLVSFLFPFTSSLTAKQPNLVILFIDDLGYADIGPFGATKQKTPNLDRMAREGMKLTSFYAAPVCSVSRAQMMTGCYGARVSVPGVYPPGSRNGLNPAETTIAEHLKKQGYATQCIGKWHLGDQPPFLPTKQGFDHYLGIPYSNDMLKTATVNGQRVVPLVRDEKVERLLVEEDQDRIEEIYTDEAVKFIRNHQEQPFFLYFPHTAVHTPIHPGKAFQDSSQNGRFGDWVQEVDWSVGRVLDTLRELKLDENTLVVFTSDNGPWLIKGPDGGSALPLRGGKGSTWEGGVRVPTLAWWPGKIAPGAVCDAVAGTIDLLPTCVSIAGGKVPAKPVIDGRDLTPLLFGQTKESQREAHYYFSSYNLQAVRQGPWKLALMTQASGKTKGAVDDDARVNPRLYNLDQEINEQTNLAAQHPDIVARLTALATRMTAEIGGTEPTARRPAGEVENPVTLYPTSDGPREKQQPGAVKAAPLDTLKPGDKLDSAQAPQITRKAFILSCQVTTLQRDGIIVAHGGASIGYALHLRDGQVCWTLRHGKTESRTQTSFPSDGKPHRITAALAKDGTMSVQVDDLAASSSKAPGLLLSQPKEDFCVGFDNKVPVTNYPAKSKFEGGITALQVSLK